MTPEEWLAVRVQRSIEVGDPASYPEVVGMVVALRECAGLPRDVADDAIRRLRAKFDHKAPVPPRYEDLRPADGSLPERELPLVFSPVKAVAMASGTTIVLLGVELWASVVIVRVAGIGGEVHAEELQMPRGMLAHPPRLSDDLGTAYAHGGGQAFGEQPWRFEHRFRPAVPLAARRLTITLDRSGADPSVAIDLDLTAAPQQRT
jgi:hypothetical protein